MGRRRTDKIARAAHIKSRTDGTSNELSFSVLDERRQRLDEEDPAPQEPSPFGRISLFTLAGGSGSGRRRRRSRRCAARAGRAASGEVAAAGMPGPEGAPPRGVSRETRDPAGAGLAAGAAGVGLAASDDVWAYAANKEVSRRKRRRRRSRVLGGAAVAVVVAAIVAGAGAYAYQYYVANEDGVARLERSIGLLFGTDELLDSLDAAVVDPFGEEAASLRSTAQAGMDQAEEELEEAEVLARAASGEVRLPSDQEAAAQAVVAITERQNLLALGSVLLQTADEAQAALDDLNDAWEHLLTAAELTSQAADLVADTTEENVEESLALNGQAAEELSLAETLISQAEAKFSLDLSAYREYIEKRQEALTYAAASDEALLDKDKETASAQNDAYNEADAQAVALAEALPDDPADLVEEAYEDAVAATEDAYDDARGAAATADAFLRDYLGE